VHRVEVAAVVARDDRLRRPAPGHVVQAARVGRQVPLGAEEDAVLVPGAAGRHGHARGRPELGPLDLADVAVGIAAQLDLGDENDGQLRAAGRLQDVGRDIKLVVLGQVDAAFVEKGVPRRVC